MITQNKIYIFKISYSHVQAVLLGILTFQWRNASVFLAYSVSWAVFVVGTQFLFATNLFIQRVSKVSIRAGTEWPMLTGSANRIPSTNHWSFANIHAFPLSKCQGVDLARFSIRTLIIASTFFCGCANASSTLMKAWAIVVLVTFRNTLFVYTNLARQTISYWFTGCYNWSIEFVNCFISFRKMI